MMKETIAYFIERIESDWVDKKIVELNKIKKEIKRGRKKKKYYGKKSSIHIQCN